jgi:hypothetical protein
MVLIYRKLCSLCKTYFSREKVGAVPAERAVQIIDNIPADKFNQQSDTAGMRSHFRMK